MAEERRATIDVPAPTQWPMIAAFGITLAWAGLVTNVLVSVVGVIATLWGAVGWFREVLPVSEVRMKLLLRARTSTEDESDSHE